MSVLVLGGTGAIGTHTVEILDKRGINTTVTSRKSIDSVGNVDYIKGNARDLEFLKSLLDRKWEAIVDFMVYSNEEFAERVDMLLASTNQYVFLSSARVYADSSDNLTEESPRLLDVSKDEKFVNSSEYSLKKAQQEDILKSKDTENWTIVRPYITYSENRLQLGVLEKEDWLYRVLKGRKIIFSEDLRNKLTTVTYGLDVSLGIASLILAKDAKGQVFHITSNKSITWGEVIEVYLDVLSKHLGYTPQIVFQNLGNFVKLKSRYQVIYDRMYHRKFDNSKIAKFVDINSFTDYQVGLSQCLEKFLKNGNFNKINWKAEARKDRLGNERTPLGEIAGIKQKLKYLFYRYIYN